jgi:hypothetical protein
LLIHEKVIPQSHDIQTNVWGELNQKLSVNIQRQNQEAGCMCGDEKNDGNDKLGKEEEERGSSRFEDPFIPVFQDG